MVNNDMVMTICRISFAHSTSSHKLDPNPESYWFEEPTDQLGAERFDRKERQILQIAFLSFCSAVLAGVEF